jgi:hypothetical protein
MKHLTAVFAALTFILLATSGCSTSRPYGEPEHLQGRPLRGEEKLSRQLEPVSPRGKQNQIKQASGATGDRMDRRVTPVSPRARQTYSFLRD